MAQAKWHEQLQRHAQHRPLGVPEHAFQRGVGREDGTPRICRNDAVWRRRREQAVECHGVQPRQGGIIARSGRLVHAFSIGVSWAVLKLACYIMGRAGEQDSRNSANDPHGSAQVF